MGCCECKDGGPFPRAYKRMDGRGLRCQLQDPTTLPEHSTFDGLAQPADLLAASENEHKDNVMDADLSGGLTAPATSSLAPVVTAPDCDESERERDRTSRLPIAELAGVTMVGYHPAKNKKNQDAWIADGLLDENQHQGLFCVFDGHGGVGHHVAGQCVTHFPGLVCKHLRLEASPDEVLKRSCAEMESLLEAGSVETGYSGTTCCSLLLLDREAWVANIGDSRIVAGVRQPDGKLAAVPWSTDHKPLDPAEKQRILKAGGRIVADGDIARVYLQKKNVPGICTSRSLGDTVAASVGVIAEPTITHFTLDETVKYVLLGSDGVWEFMSNQEVVDCVDSAVNFGAGIDEAVIRSSKLWAEREAILDDISLLGLRIG